MCNVTLPSIDLSLFYFMIEFRYDTHGGPNVATGYYVIYTFIPMPLVSIFVLQFLFSFCLNNNCAGTPVV